MQRESGQVEKVVMQLRRMITAGEFAPGSRIAEIPVAQQLGVSRTPVRLALGQLEQEGLLISAPRRGFMVRQITITEIVDAFDVRGALEALACRLVVEKGLEVATRVELEECVELGAELLAKGHFVDEDAKRWSDMNQRFHHAIVRAARNEPLAHALAYNARLPLVAPGAIAFKMQSMEVSYRYMSASQAEHQDILEALKRRQASRAEALALEHAYKSRENLRASLADAQRRSAFPQLAARGLAEDLHKG